MEEQIEQQPNRNDTQIESAAEFSKMNLILHEYDRSHFGMFQKAIKKVNTESRVF